MQTEQKHTNRLEEVELQAANQRQESLNTNTGIAIHQFPSWIFKRKTKKPSHFSVVGFRKHVEFLSQSLLVSLESVALATAIWARFRSGAEPIEKDPAD